MDPRATPVDTSTWFILSFEILQMIVYSLDNCLFIITIFPESNSRPNIIYPKISHDLWYRKPSIGRGRYLLGYYLHP